MRRRHTQQSGSAPTPDVSSPQTEHLHGFLRRSLEIDSFACSNTSAGTTGSGFAVIFRLILVPSLISLWQKPRRGNNFLSDSTYGPTLPRESESRRQHPVRTSTAGIAAPVRPAGISVSDRCQPALYGCKSGNVPAPSCGSQRVISFPTPPHFIRRSNQSTGCTNFVKILKEVRNENDVSRREGRNPVLRCSL